MAIKKSVILISLRFIAFFLICLAFIHMYSAVTSILETDYALWQYILIYFQLVVETIIFFQSFLMINDMASSIYDADEPLDRVVPDVYPFLDVYVTIRYVDVNTLRKTLEALLAQDYPHDRMKVYVADDTPDKELSNQYDALCKELGAIYISDPTNIRFKSGMMNIALPKGNGEFIAFFDYDQIPLPGVLKHMVEVLLAAPDAPFVQTKKKFRDLYNKSRIWSALLYVQFFEVLEKNKQKIGTVAFAGSTACFRRKAIESVGGIPEDTFTEDNELCTALLVEGQHGLFSDIYGSLGTVPTGYQSQVAQLWRWSHGGAHVLHKNFVGLFKSKELNWKQKLDIIALLSITTTLMILFIYVFSFIPLILSGVDSPRFIIHGVSSLFYIPIGPAITYVIVAAVALLRVETPGQELKLNNLPSFVIIGLSTNFFIMWSGLLGILGIWGPRSSHGKWNRKLPMKTIAVIGFLVSITLLYFSITWLIEGYSSAIILIMIALSLLPTLPITLYYNRKSMD